MSATLDTSEVRVGELTARIVRKRPKVPADAPPVIVLHGWGASSDAVGSVVEGLGRELEVVAIDLPGFGHTEAPHEPWDVSAYATFVLNLMSTLELQRVSLLGHSFGARIGIVVADAAPDRVARVVLTGAAGIKPRRNASYYARVMLAKMGRAVAAIGGAPGRRWQDRLRERVASRDWLDASEPMRATFRLVIAEDLTPRLSRIQAPTLLLWGDQDNDTPVWMGRRMEERIPNAALVILPGGHYVYAERAGEFNRIANHFLAEAS